MAITDKIRKAFDECTVMAGVENDFECVYITKDAALLYLNEIDAEDARLRELVADLYDMAWHEYPSAFEEAFADRMRELGVEVNDGN